MTTDYRATSPALAPSWRELCKELRDAYFQCEDYPGNDPRTNGLIARADALLAQPEPEGPTLNWSEERQPCEDCRYNHCIAETPFGRFVISWKGWKEHPAVTADETPFGDWFQCWNSVEEAKSECQAEYSRRLAAAVGNCLAQAEPEGPTDEGLVRAYQAGYQPAWERGEMQGCHIDGLRNVLSRYGRPAVAQEPQP